ncbi:nuclear transport factor 2 family protein [Actinokineospora enzanensis]|uniref:nuclear transport factor 2 family protein n=1 Tax=Actinokineospora enzanensis TaxID=155975 RepID=UPI001B7F9A17|nr:nuclear transport factor 2 family protein [Actinokineospora enzanensis]
MTAMFERMQRRWIDGEPIGDLLAEDVVVEMPFAPAGRARRIEGRAAFVEFAAAGRAALPFSIEESRDVVVHRTADPDVIIVEYELVARLHRDGRRASAPFIGVLTTRDGLVVHWREYQNPMAMAAAMGQ